MSDTPTWALSLAYWFHMLATVVWVGGLAAITLLVLPLVRQAASPADGARLLEKVQRRLDPAGWFSLAMLIGTGMVQMSANPNYDGFLSISSPWAVAILIKHILFGGMIASTAYGTWVILPGIQRAMLLLARGKDAPQLPSLHRWNQVLLWVNLVLGILILASTAWARSLS